MGQVVNLSTCFRDLEAHPLEFHEYDTGTSQQGPQSYRIGVRLNKRLIHPCICTLLFLFFSLPQKIFAISRCCMVTYTVLAHYLPRIPGNFQFIPTRAVFQKTGTLTCPSEPSEPSGKQKQRFQYCCNIIDTYRVCDEYPR